MGCFAYTNIILQRYHRPDIAPRYCIEADHIPLRLLCGPTDPRAYGTVPAVCSLIWGLQIEYNVSLYQQAGATAIGAQIITKTGITVQKGHIVASCDPLTKGAVV